MAPVCSSGTYFRARGCSGCSTRARSARTWGPRCSRRWLPRGWTDSRRRSSRSCARPASFAMRCVSRGTIWWGRMARASQPGWRERMSEARSSRCWATGCKAFSPTPDSSSAREASTPGCATSRWRNGGDLRCAASAGSTILPGPAAELKAVQRRHARFVNTTMMVTGLGAAVSDGLADGRVVSGVGGQYNFVAMAHALPQARSILCLRSTRRAQGSLSSNIVWSYGHATIPRHLRDIVVTEYGIADLRGRTDREIASALVEVMDAGFQESFVADAMRAGKLPRGYLHPGGGARESRRQACGTVRVSARSRRVSRAAVRIGSDRRGDRAGPCPEMAEIGGGVLARPAHRRAPGTRCESRFRRASPRSSADGARGTGRGASTDRAPPRRRRASLDQIICFTSNNQP